MRTEVFLLPLDVAENVSPQYGEAHFPKRMERARRFLRPEDRLRCIGGGLLLHRILGIEEKALLFASHGKPCVPGIDRSFNLSHSGNYVLLALDDSEVGGDIEVMDPAHLPLAEQIFLPDERKWMQRDPLRRFYTLWTLKESVMKQRGLGMSLSPASFSVLPLLQGEGIQILETTLYAATGILPGHCFSVCTSHRMEPLTPKFLTAGDILGRQQHR